MANIVREVKDAAATRPSSRPSVGLRPDGSLVDQAGRTYARTEDSISEDRALELAAAGAAVVWDSCGCGGGCALDWYSAEEVTRMIASGPPTIAHTKRKRGAISEWRAPDGSALLLAEVAVRWAELMS
jgi:hypothetical protein